MPRYTISIIAWNRLELTRACVSSVLAHSKDFELFLTNNNSTDGTEKYFNQIRDTNPHCKIHVIHNAHNDGFQ